MSTQIREATTTLDATQVEGKPGRLKIGIISPGQGSSGFYSTEVLEQAGKDKVFPKGTHMYLNHPTATEQWEQPERDVTKLGAVLQEDAYWDASLGKLVAEADVVGPYRDLLTDPVFRAAVGTSIIASAEVEETTTGRVITKLVEGRSVDFVTHAGRGGSILDVLESARPDNVNERAMHHGVTEATVNDKREALMQVVRDAYAGDKTYVWLRDFDETTAWFDVETGDGAGTWQQSYSTGENDLADALTGERTEVRPVTTYVPVHPAGQNTQESSGGHMATTQIEESELSGLREKAGRVSALESERDTATARADKAEGRVAELEEAAATRAVAEKLDAIIGESDGDFTALEAAGLKTQAKVKDGVLDEDAFKTLVAAEAAKIAEANGAGQPRGNGRRPASTDNEVSEADLDALDADIFGETKEA